MSIPVEKRDLTDGWVLTCRDADGGDLTLTDLTIKRENLICQGTCVVPSWAFSVWLSPSLARNCNSSFGRRYNFFPEIKDWRRWWLHINGICWVFDGFFHPSSRCHISLCHRSIFRPWSYQGYVSPGSASGVLESRRWRRGKPPNRSQCGIRNARLVCD